MGAVHSRAPVDLRSCSEMSSKFGGSYNPEITVDIGIDMPYEWPTIGQDWEPYTTVLNNMRTKDPTAQIYRDLDATHRTDRGETFNSYFHACNLNDLNDTDHDPKLWTVTPGFRLIRDHYVPEEVPLISPLFHQFIPLSFRVKPKVGAVCTEQTACGPNGDFQNNCRCESEWNIKLGYAGTRRAVSCGIKTEYWEYWYPCEREETAKNEYVKSIQDRIPGLRVTLNKKFATLGASTCPFASKDGGVAHTMRYWMHTWHLHFDGPNTRRLYVRKQPFSAAPRLKYSQPTENCNPEEDAGRNPWFVRMRLTGLIYLLSTRMTFPFNLDTTKRIIGPLYFMRPNVLGTRNGFTRQMIRRLDPSASFTDSDVATLSATLWNDAQCFGIYEDGCRNVYKLILTEAWSDPIVAGDPTLVLQPWKYVKDDDNEGKMFYADTGFKGKVFIINRILQCQDIENRYNPGSEMLSQEQVDLLNAPPPAPVPDPTTTPPPPQKETKPATAMGVVLLVPSIILACCVLFIFIVFARKK